jgi:hypothetical protein
MLIELVIMIINMKLVRMMIAMMKIMKMMGYYEAYYGKEEEEEQ